MGERTAEDRKVEGSTPSRGIFMDKEILKRLSKADSFSILNALFGMTSILFLPNLKFSFIFLLLAVLSDGIDGSIARRYGSSMPIIDEFADMISFVAAPSAILFCYGIQSLPFIYAYVIASMIHLLNYHYGEKDAFPGLPTPAAAIVIAILCFLSFPFYIVAIASVILSILVASPIKYPRIIGIERIAGGIAIIVAIAFPYHLIAYILLILTLAYIIFAPLK